jgi:hypothetical protein
MYSKIIVIGFSTFTVAAGIMYWASVFGGQFPVTELVPGYRTWFMSFPPADGWIFLCGILAAFFAQRNHPLAALFGPLTGSGLIFLGLYAFTYGINTGLIFILTPDELIEIAIKIYCLCVGFLLIFHGWRLREA